MKIFIKVLNYVDTVDVFVDGVKIEKEKLSLSSKAEFVYDVESGIHEIYFDKKSNISRRHWKKGVVYNWISCLSGTPDWTLKEMALDTIKSSMMLKVNVGADIQIDLKLTDSGFELIGETKDIIDTVKQTEIDKTAKKRVKNLYMSPAILFAILIEICMLAVCVLLILNRHYVKFIIIIVLSVFWAWLVCSMIFKDRK